MAYMGVDIGTTGTKAVVMQADGSVVASAYRDYPLQHPKPGWAELDPNGVWNAVKEVIAKSASDSNQPIQAVAFSALGEAVTPVNRDGEPLDQTIVAMDNRAEAECRWLGETIGAKRLYEITGQPLHPMYTLNKILWWRKHKPEMYDKTWKFLCWQDYAAFKLCGNAVIDYSLASRVFIFDLREKCWNPLILEKTGIPVEKLPAVQPSGTVIGTVVPSIAQELGLSSDTKVVCGGFDQPSAALGAGILSPGTAVDGLGTVECITPALDRPVTDDKLLQGNIPCNPHVVSGLYIFMGFNFSSGSLLQWYRDRFAYEEAAEAKHTGKDVYELILEKALATKSSVMVLPHFLGSGTPHLDPHAKGAVVGLSLTTTRHEIARAVLEGVTFEMRLNLEILEGSGVIINELRATGGGAKSHALLQLKANMWGKPITAMKTTEGGCLAMAMQSAVACGEYATITDAASEIICTGVRFEPDMDIYHQYSERFKAYTMLYSQLKPVHRFLQ